MTFLSPQDVFSVWLLLHVVVLSGPPVFLFSLRTRGRPIPWHYLIAIVPLAVVFAMTAPSFGLLVRPGGLPILLKLLWGSRITATAALLVSCGLTAWALWKLGRRSGGVLLTNS